MDGSSSSFSESPSCTKWDFVESSWRPSWTHLVIWQELLIYFFCKAGHSFFMVSSSFDVYVWLLRRYVWNRSEYSLTLQNTPFSIHTRMKCLTALRPMCTWQLPRQPETVGLVAVKASPNWRSPASIEFVLLLNGPWTSTVAYCWHSTTLKTVFPRASSRMFNKLCCVGDTAVFKSSFKWHQRACGFTSIRSQNVANHRLHILWYSRCIFFRWSTYW